MKKVFFGIIKLAFGFVFILNNIPSVMAQESSDYEFTLEEITVTAEKREENMQKVPIFMNVVEGDKLSITGRNTLDEVLESISTVLVTQFTTEMLVSIRGMDKDSVSHGAPAMVAIVVDGVYTNTLGSGFSGMFDVSRVEVLSGPQSTLYGRNAAGGVVHLVSNDPSIENFDASGSIEFGNYDKHAVQAMLNIPISDKSAFRSAVSYSDRRGFNSDGTDDDNTMSSRLKYLYSFNEDLSVKIQGVFTRQKGKGQGDGIIPFETEDDVDDPWTGRWDSNIYYIDRNFKQYTLTVDWKTPIGQLTVIPSAEKAENWTGRAETIDEGDEVVGIQRNAQDLEEEKSFEARLASPVDSFLEWMVGVYWYDLFWDQSSISSDRYVTMQRGTKQKATFANFTYPVSDRFRLNPGVRYTVDDAMALTQHVNKETLLPIYPMYDDEEKHRETNHFDYKMTIEYDLKENSMLWVDYSTGYKAAPVHQDPPYYDQELKSYQLGINNRFLNNSLQLNATAWYYDYQNFQLSVSEEYVDPDTGIIETDTGTGTSNAVLYGLDLDGSYRITGKDTIKVAYSYLHSAIDNTTIVFEYLPESDEYNGLTLNNSPEHTFVASYSHRFDLSNGGSFLATLDTRYATETFLNATQAVEDPTDEYNTQPTYHMSNASLNYASPTGKWDINAYVKNIENLARKNGINHTRYDSAGMRLDPPRTYGVVLSVRY